ncbi:unnamed protein product [Prorocentrum cordatum]|uniref:Uncharacterized protein n=1 Tax=Prorocentrum cordatum TaxID=2364126 RepID=A0ABN9YA53_9DINO|nr:unnamed protein product [Polarella glacialis]
MTRATSAENLCSWPLGRGGAPAAEVVGHAAGTPPAGAAADMAQVMSLAFPRSSGSSSGGGHQGARPKHGGPSELLGSSALRMVWPSERRQASGAEAAAACREAAASLQEAAAQLLGAATGLDGGAGASGHGAGGDRAAAQERRWTSAAGAPRSQAPARPRPAAARPQRAPPRGCACNEEADPRCPDAAGPVPPLRAATSGTRIERRRSFDWPFSQSACNPMHTCA